MITLHYLEDSRALRIIWLLEELNLPYQLKMYKRNPKTMLAPDSLKKIHPLGKSPVIVDEGTVVAESAVIIEYLALKYAGKDNRPALIPENDPDAKLQYTYWMHYAEGSLMPFLVMALVFQKVKTSPAPFFVRPIVKEVANRVIKTYIAPNLDTHIDVLESHLARNDYFAGNTLSGADFQMIYPLQAILERGRDASQCPNIAAYLKRLQSRPAYQSACTKIK